MKATIHMRRIDVTFFMIDRFRKQGAQIVTIYQNNLLERKVYWIIG